MTATAAAGTAAAAPPMKATPAICADRGPARPHQGELATPVVGDQPRAEQHHHRRDGGQADEQQRERALHGGVDRHE